MTVTLYNKKDSADGVNFQIAEHNDLVPFKSTSYHGVEVSVNPEKLIETLGNKPSEGEGKITKEWWFLHAPTGEVFSLYDWKQTSNYDSEFPSVNEFWSNDKVILHIGHSKSAIFLAQKLKETLEELCA